MSVVHLHSGMSGAPSILARSAGTWAQLMHWALPQLGWTLAEDDLANHRVAYTNSDGHTFAFYDSSSHPESNGTNNTECAVRIFDGFTGFDTPGFGAPFSPTSGVRFVNKFVHRASTNATSAGYLIWGDDKTFITLNWTVGGNNSENGAVQRPRYALHYFGRVNSLVAGQFNTVFLGSSSPGIASASAEGYAGMQQQGAFPAILDVDGNPLGRNLNIWRGTNRNFDNWLSASGENQNPVTGERHISRVFLGSAVDAAPEFFCRGMYCGVGNWRDIFISQDSLNLPAMNVDVGSRVLTPYMTETGHINSTGTAYWGHGILLDRTGPWS